MNQLKPPSTKQPECWQTIIVTITIILVKILKNNVLSILILPINISIYKNALKFMVTA